MKKAFLLLFLAFTATIGIAQTTYFNIVNTALDNPANWTTDGTIAGASASSFTSTGDVFNLSSAPNATSLSAPWSLGVVTLNITVAVTFNNSKAVSFNGTTVTSSSNLTFSAAGNTLTVGDGITATSLTMTAGNLSFGNATAKLSIAALATVDMQGAASAVSAYTPTTITDNGTFRTASTVAAPFPASKDFTNGGAATGTVEFYAAANQTIVAGTYYDLTTTGSGNRTHGVITVKHALNVGAGTVMKPSATTTNITGTGATISGGGTITATVTSVTALTTQYNFTVYNLSSMTVDYNSNAAQSIASSATVGNYGSLKVTTVNSGVKTLLGDVTVLGDVSITATTQTGALAASTHNINVGGDWNVNGTGAKVFNGGTGTVIFNGTGAQAISIAGGTATPNFFNLENANTSATLSMNNNTAVTGSFTNDATATFSAGTSTLTITGNYLNSGAFSAGTGTVAFNSAAAGQTIDGNVTGANQFYNLSFTGASPGAWSFVPTSVDVANNFTISGTGIVTAPATLLQVGGNFAHTGGTITNFLANGGTVNLNGAGSQAFPGATATKFNILTLDNGNVRTLTLNGATTILSAFTNPSNVTLATGASALTDSLDFTNNGTYTATTQALIVNGDFYNAGTCSASSTQAITVNGNYANSGSFTSGTGATALTIKGNFNNTGTFSGSTGTVVMTAASTGHMLTGSMTGGNQFNNLTFNNAAGAWSFGSSADVGGAFTITTGAVTAPSGTLQIGGNFAHTAGSFIHNYGTVNLNGSGAQSLPGTLATIFNTLTIDNSTTRIITLNKLTTVVAALTIPSNITLSTAALGLTDSSDLTIDGILATTGAQPLIVMGNLTNTGSLTTTGAQVTTVGGNFTNAGIFASTAAALITTVGGDFANSGTFNCGTGATALTIKGSYSNTGTFNASTGTTTFSSPSGSESLSGNMTGTNKFNNLTFNNAGGIWTFGSSAADVAGIFTITNGAVTAPSTSLKVAGNFVHTAGTFTNNGGVVELNGTVAQTVPGATATSFYDLNISNTAANVTANATISVSHSLVTSGTTILDMVAHILNGTFDASGNSGNIKTSCPTTTTTNPVPSGITWGGTVTYYATTVAQNVVQGSYNNLTLTGTTGAKTFGAGTTTVAADLSITTTSGNTNFGGPLNVGGDLSIAASTGSAILGGALNVDGSIALSTSSTGAAVLDASATNYLVNVGGDWTTSGGTAASLFNARAGTVVFDGSGVQTISKAAGGVTAAIPNFFNVTNANTTAALVIDTSINVTGTFSVTAGALVTPVATAVLNPAVANGSITGNGTIQVTRTVATPDYSSQYRFTTNTLGNLTVDYAATADQNVNLFTYGTLKTSGSGTKTAQGALTVNNGLNVGTGTVLDMGSTNRLLSGTAPTYTVTGTLKTSVLTATSALPVPSGATWNGTGTVEYAATGGLQTIVNGIYSGLTLDNISVANTTGTGDITVNGAFAIGKLTLGTNNLILGSAASISGAGAANYVVTNGAGRLRKGFATNGSFAFPVGDVTNYTPIAVNVTGAAYAAAYVESGVVAMKDPHNSNSNNFLNRYWNIATSGITSPSWSVTAATYVPGDITGTESLMSAASYTGSLPWTLYSVAGSNTLTTTSITSNIAEISGLSNTPPTVSVDVTSASYCSGGTQAYTASGSGDGTLTYTWAPNTNLSATTGASVTANPTTGSTASVITYTVTIADGNGVTATATTVLTVNPQPTSITGAPTVCLGQTSTLSSTPSGGNWSSVDATISIGSTSGMVTGLSNGTATITYGFTTGCFTTSVVTVSPLPSAISGAASICMNTSITLSDATSGGTWSSSNSAIASVGTGTGIVTGNTAGAATITYMLASGCYSIVTINIMPAPVAISGASSVCIGATAVLSDATLGGMSWTSSNTAIATVGSGSGVATGISAGTTNITYTLTSGCFITKTLTVNTAPGTISGVATLCAGSTATFTCSPTGGTWSSSSAAVASVGSTTGDVTANAASTAIITYNLSGCIKIAGVTVRSLPAAITGGTGVCAGSNTTLYCSTTGGTWTSSTAAVGTIGATGIVSGISNGTTTVSYTLSTGCARAATVTVSSAPSISGVLGLCIGSSSTLIPSGSGGTWTSSTTGVAAVGISSGIVSGIATGTSVISYIISASCKSGTIVTVGLAPAAISGAISVCVGSPITLTDATTGGTWSSGNTAKATVDITTGLVTGVSPGTTTITYAVGGVCLVTKAIAVGGGLGPITGTTGFCVGASAALIPPASGSSWTSSNAAVATIGSISGAVTGISPGTSTITFKSYDFGPYAGCLASLTVTVDAAPSVAAITGLSSVIIGQTITLADATAGGNWSSDNTAKATITLGGVVTGIASAAATISYTKTNGVCMVAATKVLTITASRQSGSFNTEMPAMLTVLPNPNSGSFIVNAPLSGTFVIYTVEGKELQQNSINEGANPVQLPAGLAAGMYVCRFSGSDGSTTLVRIVYKP